MVDDLLPKVNGQYIAPSEEECRRILIKSNDLGKRLVRERKCKHCTFIYYVGKRVKGMKDCSSVYCSKKCKQAAYRERELKRLKKRS